VPSKSIENDREIEQKCNYFNVGVEMERFYCYNNSQFGGCQKILCLTISRG
jgi:hypothetical protein